MISENSLSRMCTPAVLNRAHRIVALGECIHARRCRYDSPETLLSAKVDADDDWDSPYRVDVVLDEGADSLVDFDCGCMTSARPSGPCKHVMALCLDFNERPEAYDGYDSTGRLATSRGVSRMMEQAREVATEVVGASSEDSPHTVGLELTLSHEVGFDARFRLLGSQGAYVIKSLTDFASDVEAGAYRSYGKRLAFVHAQDAFTAHAWEVARFVMRAVQNRRAYAYQRVMSRGAYGTSSLPGRELHLSVPELEELLDLYAGRTVIFEDLFGTAQTAGTRALEVVRGNPALRFGVEHRDDGTFELAQEGTVRMAAVGIGAIAWDDHCLYRCDGDLSREARLMSHALDGSAEPLVIAPRDMEEFCARVLPRIEAVAGVSVPPELESLKPAPCKLQFYLDRTDRAVVLRAQAQYGDRTFVLIREGAASRDVSGDDFVRDLAAEARGREVVRRFFATGPMGEAMIYLSQGDALAALLYEGIPLMQQMGEVYATSAFERIRSHARPRARVGLSLRSGLLRLTIAAEGVPQSELADVLASVREHKGYHRLRDGSFIRLADPDGSLGRAGAVVAELGLASSDVERGEVTSAAYRALSIESLLTEEERDASVESYLQGIHAQDLSRYEVPESLRGVLRHYQVEGYQWMRGLSSLGLGGILADEMGLGKSVQLITYVLSCRDEARGIGPTLVVCPASLVYNWEAEFSKFAPELDVSVVAGTVRERAEVRRDCRADVLITSYDLLRRDVDDYAGMELWCVALDEAQYIKNHETQVARAVKRLVARHRLALTGTPVENRLSELWSIFDFLMPGLLGRYEDFRERYERPVVEEGDAEIAERLRSVLRPFVLRRTKRSVMGDLPDKIEQVVRARMGAAQRTLYDAQVQELRDTLSEKGEDGFARGKLQVLSMLTRLRQICCDPALVFDGYEGRSAKTDTIVTLVERVCDAGEKLLVFSQFTGYLDRLADELDSRGIPYYMLVGSTPKRRRAQLVDAFNADDTPVFLISLKAGGTGLNLTSATVVVHADPWWNAAAQNQATDRAHRIGQTRDVTVYKVIARDTLEERILDLQRAKAELADAIVGTDASSSLSLANLTREDLEDLLA